MFLKELIGLKVSKNKALIILNNIFQTGKIKGKNRTYEKKIIILVIDELDYLLTANQQLLYNIFDWPS